MDQTVKQVASGSVGSTFLRTPPLSTKKTPTATSHSLPEYTPSMEMLHLSTLHRLNVVGAKRGNTTSKTLSRSKNKKNGMARSDSGRLSGSRGSLSSGMDWEFADDYNFDDDEENDLKTDRENEKRWTLDQTTYTNACQKMKITPCSTVFKGLPTKIISIKRHDVGPKGAKACAIALTTNSTVERLDMESNCLGPEGAESICDMLIDSAFIVELNLAYNGIGTTGLRVICDMLRVNETLRKLDISGNCLKEKDAIHIKDMLEDNIVLTELIISHNEFREEGGEILAEALRKNVSLEVLDLSWNHLRRRGATSIAKSLEKNIGIHTLNLGWNGFYLDGCSELGKSLAVNSTLLNLDLSSNRINKECLARLLKALKKNETLTSIDLSFNPIGADGALDMVDLLIACPTAKVSHVDIHTQEVNADFINKAKELPQVTFKVGVQSSMDTTPDDDLDQIFLKDDPMMVLMEFARLKRLRLVDLFSSLDKDLSGSLSHLEFRTGLLNAGVPLSMKALDCLISKLDDNNDGEVDFSELMVGQKDHKKKVHVLKQDADANDVHFLETEIGIVSAKLMSLFKLQDMLRMKRMMSSGQGRVDEQGESSGGSGSGVKKAWGAMKRQAKATEQND